MSLRFASALLGWLLCIHLSAADTPPSSRSPTPTPTLHWELLRKTARTHHHFTQGLVFAGDTLFESTGRYGQSSVRAYNAYSLSETQQTRLPDSHFGEGLTALKQRLYQLTWTNRELHIYNLQLQLEKTLPYDRDGWGLTTDGRQLISSDGSSTLVFRQPDSGQETRRISVIDSSGAARDQLNELEWINGSILANIWHSNTVLMIDPHNGAVLGQYDFTALSLQMSRELPNRNSEQTLNGMAWNPRTQTLLITGKDWPAWFEVRLLSEP
jgi:glutamine cyclotransferase